MKLAVSNIAWEPAEEDAVLTLCERLGVQGIEVAPTKLWPDFRGASRAAAEARRALLAARGFEVPALQALLFGRPDLLVFGEPAVQARLLQHLASVAELGQGLGAQALVFGSPKNRDRGDLSIEQANAEAASLFVRVGAACAERGVRLCLEPNPRVYGCNFLTHWSEVKALVDRVAHPGVAIHLDTACIVLEGDDPLEAIEACAGNISHFHVTEPNLADFSAPVLDHAAIGRSLRAAGYTGFLSIEMRRSDDPLRSIEQAVSFVSKHYS
jgi:D-psicose/D-tagatose/L-ribulose 3-epimerase